MFQNTSRAYLLAAVWMAMLVMAVQPASSQAISGDIVGTITDASGAALPNATVEALQPATGVRSSAVTNASGQYRLSNLPNGSYDLTAKAAGFTASALKGVLVDVNKIATANLTLQVGQVSASIDVTEAASVIDTTTATVANTFETRQARDLPVSSIGLGVYNLSLLGSGVASNGGIGAGEGPSVGGQRPRNNNFTIEGVDNNNKTVTGSLIRFIPNDAVAEFSLLQNQFSAEFGHSSGGQFNAIVKSGTNEVHGTLSEYFQNRNLNAIDQVVQNQSNAAGLRPKNPRNDNNRLGASIGGPILKNKLFYFGAFEYNPFGGAATPAGVLTPTAEGFARLATIPGLNQTNLGILKQYAPPAPSAASDTSLFPTVSGIPIPAGILPIVAPNYQNGYYAVASSDYNISEKDQLRGRFLYNKLSSIDFQAQLPVFFLLNPNTYYVATLAEYHNFSPNLTNEFRLGYNRLNQTIPAGNFKFPGLDSFPNLQFGDLGGLNVGPDPNAPQNGVQNTYQITDTATWVHGAHTFRFGFDGRKYIAPSSFTQRSRGDYEYSRLEIYLKDLTPDSVAQRGVGNVVYYGDQISLYPYFNDAWRLRPNLTLNLGLRYEFSSVPYSERLQVANAVANTPGVLVFKKPEPQYKNFAPRVGIAYSPGNSAKTSIRAGFGIAYDVIFDNIGSLSLPPQFNTTVDASVGGDPLSAPPNFLKSGGISPTAGVGALSRADAIANTSAYIPDQKLPYSVQWNFGIQHVFAKDYTFEARYLGTRGVHLDVQQRFSKTSAVTASHSLPTYLQAPGQGQLDALPLTLSQLRKEPNVLPQFLNAGFVANALVENAPIGNSIYHGLALQLNRRFSNNLQFIGAYTWSHLIDDSTADFFTTVLTPRRPQDFQNIRAERSSSALDRRHRFTFSAIYETPWFRRGNWFAKNMLGNWNVAPIYTYESPEYATVQSQLDSNLNGDSWGDRTIVNPKGAAGLGSDVTPLLNSSGETVAYLAKNPNARYIKAGFGAYANGGRNTLPLRPTNNFDLNILKNFAVTERTRVQFSAQFFNFFNHPQFLPGFPDRVDNPQVLATSGAVRNFLTAGDPTFNNPEAVFSSNPRAIQLALKVLF